VKHRVSGRWSHTIVADLRRNTTVIGVQEYGKRSEGTLRRLGRDGPRLLDDETGLSASGKVRVVVNDPPLRIGKQVDRPQFDPGRRGDPTPGAGTRRHPAGRSRRKTRPGIHRRAGSWT
jgi:hypothetical protein